VIDFALKKMTLDNYRCFKHIEIDFHPEMTVLVGENGGGKTALLDAVAVALGPFVSGLSEGKGVHFKVSDIYQRLLRVGGKQVININVPLKQKINGIFSDDEVTWERELRGKKSRTTIGKARPLIHLAKQLEQNVMNENNVVLPLISYYGTGRLWRSIKFTEAKSQASKNTSPISGYIDCLDPASSYNAAADWMRYAHLVNVETNMDNPDNGQAPYEVDLKAIDSAVNCCTEHTGWKGIRYSVQYKELTMVHESHGRLPVSYLSDGIRNVVGVALDIAYRAVKLNHWLGKDAISRTPGIVMIDEVDMHLHPSWQQEILPALSKAFPKIQFIVSTHSPQVLTTVKPECIRILKLKTGEYSGKNIYEAYAPQFSLGAESKYVLEDIQFVQSRPQKIDVVANLNKYLELVNQNKWDSGEAVKLRDSLDAWGKSFEPKLTAVDVDIRMREYRRQQANSKK